MKTEPSSEQWQDIADVAVRNICDYARILPEYEREIRKQVLSAIERSHTAQPQHMKGEWKFGQEPTLVPAETPTQRGEQCETCKELARDYEK
jgi:hypothetical protein